MEPGCEQYCEGELDEVEQTRSPLLKFAAAKAVTERQSRAERSSSCIRRTSTYGGYKVFVEFDF
jgi:hypothetical protein